MVSSFVLLMVLTAAACLGYVAPAYAYLDPGTGSILLQVLLGGTAGAIVVGKLYWERLKAFSRSIFASKRHATGTPTPGDRSAAPEDESAR